MVQDYRLQKEQLETQISTQRSVWEMERQTAERERREQEEGLKKQRQRENDDFEYRKALERKKAQDKFGEEQRQQERKNNERQDGLEKGWAAREAALKEQEQELARLRGPLKRQKRGLNSRRSSCARTRSRSGGSPSCECRPWMRSSAARRRRSRCSKNSSPRQSSRSRRLP
ncbi:MAG TPA: hypothetical protein VFA04_06645 [Bryobacteraceae bacterium]|nr:hypothetical protein [Bryobacteraceae bacterium]